MFSHMHTGAALVTAVILAGCTSTNPPAAQLPPPTDCGASLLQDQIGEPVTGSAAGDVQVGGDPVQSQGVVRVYVSGQPVTQDYSESRLNLETDAAGNLVRATCG
jgi:hypothetical protein